MTRLFGDEDGRAPIGRPYGDGRTAGECSLPERMGGRVVNLLLDAVPRSVVVGGVRYAVNWQFEYMVLVELILSESGMDDSEKMARALMVFYRDELPPDLGAARDALVRFYVGDAPKMGSAKAGDAEALYSYEHDGDLIFAAFWQAYGINLNRAKDLHWYEFRALLRGLGEDCLFAKAVGYRAMDLSKIKDGEARQRYKELKGYWALPVSDAEREANERLVEILRGDGDLTKLH